MKILVTAGGMSEDIDGVRKISNSSTGRTGVNIANELIARGHEVSLLLSAESNLNYNQDYTEFRSHQDLDVKLSEALDSGYDWLVHSAAVSDFLVDEIHQEGKKIDSEDKLSSGQTLTIKLIPSKKIINAIKPKFPNLKLFSFKFTKTEDPLLQKKAVEKLIAQSGADAVLWNDAYLKTKSSHPYKIFDSNQELNSKGSTPQQLATDVAKFIEECP